VRRTATVALRNVQRATATGWLAAALKVPVPVPLPGLILGGVGLLRLVTTAGENGLSISARRLKLLCPLHESGSGSAPRRRESSVEEDSTRRVVD
jgi:hypothetical protein